MYFKDEYARGQMLSGSEVAAIRFGKIDPLMATAAIRVMKAYARSCSASDGLAPNTGVVVFAGQNSLIVITRDVNGNYAQCMKRAPVQRIAVGRLVITYSLN